MKRQRRSTRVISRLEDGTYVDHTVIAVIGGNRPHKVLKEVIHGTYECVGVLVGELVEAGVTPPAHSAVYIDPGSWTYQYLKRIS